jgi:hypothetical protein
VRKQDIGIFEFFPREQNFGKSQQNNSKLPKKCSLESFEYPILEISCLARGQIFGKILKIFFKFILLVSFFNGSKLLIAN